MDKLPTVDHHLRPVSSSRSNSNVKGKRADSERVASRFEEVSDRKKVGKVKEKAEDESTSKQKKKATHPGMTPDRKQSLKDDSQKESPFEMFSRKQKETKFELNSSGKSTKGSEKQDRVISLFAAKEDDEEFDTEEIKEEVGSKHTSSETASFDQRALDSSFATDKPFIEAKTSHLSKSSPNELMTKLANKIVQKIVSVKSGGKTDIIISLKGSLNFNRGQLKVTEFETAKGQFNLEFSNLSAKAHSFVTNQSNINILRQAMSEKGYAVHIVNATTEEKVLQLEGAETFAREEKGSKGGHKQQDDSEQEEKNS